jgi:hypothetical protein
MPKWNENDTIFPVKVAYSEKGDKRFGKVVIPKPLLRLMKFPNSVYFELKNGEVFLRIGIG